MIPSIREQINDLRGVEGQDREYYERLKDWWFDYGQLPPYGWAWKQARRYAQTLDNFGVGKNDDQKVRQAALEYRRMMPKKWGVQMREHMELDQNDLDREVMRLHFRRLTITE